MPRAKKRVQPVEPVDVTKLVTFKQLTEAFINATGQIVLSFKMRAGGAASYGTDGMFVAAVEALHTARQSRNLEDFLKAAAYSVGAALIASGSWDLPLEAPTPAKKTRKKAKKGVKN